MSELLNAIARLDRSTWDSRVLPARDDVRVLLDAFRRLSNPDALRAALDGGV
jgi:hypothetical protein